MTNFVILSKFYPSVTVNEKKFKLAVSNVTGKMRARSLNNLLGWFMITKESSKSLRANKRESFQIPS